MSPGSKVYNELTPPGADIARRQRILVADEDPRVVEFIVQTLRHDGYAVFHAPRGLSATELAFSLDKVHLVISNTRVNSLPGIELIYLLRARLPQLPILYIANIDRSTPAIEPKLPRDVPILREPSTAEELRAIVEGLLKGSDHLV